MLGCLEINNVVVGTVQYVSRLKNPDVRFVQSYGIQGKEKGFSSHSSLFCLSKIAMRFFYGGLITKFTHEDRLYELAQTTLCKVNPHMIVVKCVFTMKTHRKEFYGTLWKMGFLNNDSEGVAIEIVHRKAETQKIKKD